MTVYLYLQTILTWSSILYKRDFFSSICVYYVIDRVCCQGEQYFYISSCFTGPPFSGSYGPGPNGGTNFPPNGPQGDFPGNMLPMSPGQNMNNINNMNSINSPDMMSKPLSHPGQYPLSPPESTTHLRHPPVDQGMTNNLPSSSQSQVTSNHSSGNGTQPQQQPSNNNVGGQQQNPVGDDLNFDPTAIIDGDGSAAGLEVRNKVYIKKSHSKNHLLCQIICLPNHLLANINLPISLASRWFFEWLLLIWRKMVGTFYSLTFELPRDKTNKMACGPGEDSDQPGHPPSLMRVFAVHSVGS